jgi:hypothetical protein
MGQEFGSLFELLLEVDKSLCSAEGEFGSLLMLPLE